MYISINHVWKRFGNKVVLRDVCLQAEKGQFVALLGPSGCGKTTLLNALAGLTDVDEGDIEVSGRLYSSNGYTLEPERRKIGMVFQDFALWPHMTVFENVAFGLKVQRMPRARVRERVMEVLQIVRMEGYEKRYPHQLSGGQKQRVAIARALAPEPGVLLMDEPLSSLDAKLREDMRWELLGIVQRAHTTTIYVTHDQIEALSMADHIVVLREGSVEQQGSAVSLYERPETDFTAAFLGPSNIFEGRVTAREGAGASSSTVVDCGGLLLQVSHGAAEVGERVAVTVRPADVRIMERKQEDARTGHPADGDTGDTSGGEVGTWIDGVVLQRAFHGSSWQYRVGFGTTSQRVVEVWYSQVLDLGTMVRLFFPVAHCRLVKPSVAGVGQMRA